MNYQNWTYIVGTSLWWKCPQGRSGCQLTRGPSTSFGWRLTSLRTPELKRTRQLIAINQAQRRRKGSDAASFFGVMRTRVLERFSAVLIPPIFPLT
jgi:hypothetical protein